MSEVLLRLDDIHVRFANQNVLEGAQLQVHRGEIVTLIGPNGAGKTTLVRAVLGLPLGSTAARGHACMLNWIGAMPDAGPVLAEAGGHWHDYGKQARDGRKVGHATLRADDAGALAVALARVGAALGRSAQVEPVIGALRAI